jgi:hypothetical protein
VTMNLSWSSHLIGAIFLRKEDVIGFIDAERCCAQQQSGSLLIGSFFLENTPDGSTQLRQLQAYSLAGG